MEQKKAKTAAVLIALLGIVLTGFSFTSCEKSRERHKPADPFPGISNKVILDWNNTALAAMGAPNYQHILFATRLYAMVQIAQYDALNSIKPRYKRYGSTTIDSAAHPVAAAAVAAYTVLLYHFPEQKAMLDSQLSRSIDTIVNTEGRQKGVLLGQQCGNAIIALRKDDSASRNPVGVIIPSTVPGVYQAVPPFDFVFAPFWKTMKPFGLLQPQQFRSAPHPDLQSAAYRKDFEEVKTLGQKNSQQRSTEQTAYANFWYEYAEIGWNRIASVAAVTKNADLMTTARLFAMLNMALADAYIAGWDSKFYYDFWRPYTAIVNTPVAQGGNPTWEPLMPTPPVQDYPSTHSVLGNAAATILTDFFGDDFSFATTSTSSLTPNTPRKFSSFFSAADENADSRVMAGVHFRFSCKAGQAMGNAIGSWLLKNTLKKEN